jgi:hypothetical protein
LRDDEGERAVVIPLVVGMVPVAVEPLPVIVTVGVEDVRVTVGNVYLAIYATTH